VGEHDTRVHEGVSLLSVGRAPGAEDNFSSADSTGQRFERIYMSMSCVFLYASRRRVIQSELTSESGFSSTEFRVTFDFLHLSAVLGNRLVVIQ